MLGAATTACAAKVHPMHPKNNNPWGRTVAANAWRSSSIKKSSRFFTGTLRERGDDDGDIEEGPPTRMSFLGRKLDSNDVSKKSLEQSSYFSPSNSKSARYLPTRSLGVCYDCSKNSIV